MQINRRVVVLLGMVVLFASALTTRVSAQSCPANTICVDNPANQSSVSDPPVWLRAQVNSCAGSSNMIAFGYSINNENFYNQGITNYDIDTTDYRLMPGATYTVWFKAWSDAGECTPVPISVTVTGTPWNSLYEIVNSEPNTDSWQVPACPYYTDASGTYRNWFWNWDDGTAQCTNSDTTDSYSNSSVSPTFDNQSRLFYVDWTGVPTQLNTLTETPGERYSITYAENAAGATNFVYDTYVYLASPQDVNVYALQLDTNQVDANGNLIVFGLQCVSSEFNTRNETTPAYWQYTDYTGWVTPSTTNDQNVLACQQLFVPDMWHHVQLKTETDGNGGAIYDSITVDGTTTQLQNWFGNSSSYTGWTAGELFLNFQIDGMYNNGNEATAVVYVDGMTTMWW